MLNNHLLAPLGIVRSARRCSAGSTAASAQTSGFVFGTPGAVTCCGESQSTVHLGGGFEGVIGDAVGIAGEIGFLGPWSSFRDGLGVFSVNGAYHFLPHQPGKRARPFVSVTDTKTSGTSAEALTTGSGRKRPCASSSATTFIRKAASRHNSGVRASESCSGESDARGNGGSGSLGPMSDWGVVGSW
jgi:hypothetical protein